jgi:sugar lactone lactonase YvrE
MTIDTNKALLVTLLLTILPFAYADQGSFTNSGGSASGSSGISISGSTVSSPAGTLSLNCPSTGPASCSGGSFSFASNDGTSVISAVFSSGSFAESCSGGGTTTRCYYNLTGYFGGTWTLNGVPQAITGVTYQSFPAPGTTGTVQGTSAFNSTYSPFYYSDTEGILRSDDLMGTNQLLYDGAKIGGFYGAYGLALDAQGRIYVADTYHCRIVRIDNMTGAHAITNGGTCGSGQGQFYDPTGIAVDSNGKIYIMDTGNSRFVRIDNITGANWVTYGAVGSGVGQFASFNWVALDSSNRIYIADAGNRRIVRIDDMTGTNWTTLTQSPPVNGVSYTFSSPVAVAADSAGKIYVADNEGSPAVVRVDDMTGLNWTSIYVSAAGSTGLNSISVDSGGTVYTGGGGVRFVDGMAGVLTSSGAIGPIGSYYVFGVTPVPLPSPRPSAVSLTPSSLSISSNVGSTSAPQPVTVFNFGGSPLTISAVSVSGSGFAQTSNCPGTLAAGSTCTVNVTFTPSAAGTVTGTLTITDNSGNLGTTQTVALVGTGTAPAASVSPTSLNFGSQIVGTTSAAQTVVLTDSGTGPMNVTNISVTGPFSQTNNCSSLAAGASCNINVTFTPTALGSASGTLSITDTAGTQTVSLSGNGVGPLILSPTSLEFSQLVGTTSAPQTVTASNQGTVSISISRIAISGAGFAISSNTCGTSLGVGASCTVGVTFAPTAIGDTTGALTFTDSAVGSPQSVSLQGNGTGAVTVSPSSLNFGTVTYGTTSSAQTVTLTNSQSTAVIFSSIVASAYFTVASNTCGTSVAAGASCTVGVTFSPNAVGTFTGTLTFTDNAPNSPQVVTLAGTGGGTPVTLSTSSLSFGNVPIGKTSSPKSVTLTNHQMVSLTFSSIVTSASFAVSSNTCGTSIAAGANCTVGVTFSPTAKATINGTLTLNDNAANSPQTVSLTGTGK